MNRLELEQEQRYVDQQQFAASLRKAVRNGAAAMDAAGTWALGVEVRWRESTSEG